MLVVTRKKDEKILVGENIRIFIIDVKGDKVRIGIDAPKNISIYRSEVLESLKSLKCLSDISYCRKEN